MRFLKQGSTKLLIIRLRWKFFFLNHKLVFFGWIIHFNECLGTAFFLDIKCINSVIQQNRTIPPNQAFQPSQTVPPNQAFNLTKQTVFISKVIQPKQTVQLNQATQLIQPNTKQFYSTKSSNLTKPSHSNKLLNLT